MRLGPGLAFKSLQISFPNVLLHKHGQPALLRLANFKSFILLSLLFYLASYAGVPEFQYRLHSIRFLLLGRAKIGVTLTALSPNTRVFFFFLPSPQYYRTKNAGALALTTQAIYLIGVAPCTFLPSVCSYGGGGIRSIHALIFQLPLWASELYNVPISSLELPFLLFSTKNSDSDQV